MKYPILFSVIAVMALVNTVGIADEPVQLQFWNGFTGPDGRYVQEIIDDFNVEYQGKIEVRMIVMQWVDFYSKVALALSTQRAPDIGVVHFDNVYNVISQGIVEELDPYLDQFDFSDFVQSALEVSRQNGHQYGIPLDFHPMVFYWNKSLFKEVGLDPEQPPSNPDEFLNACRVIRDAQLMKKGQRVWPIMVQATHPNFLFWQHILFCNGGRMFNPEYTEAAYNSKEGKDALQLMHDLIYQYEYSSANLSDNECMDSFRRGTSAMHLNGIWMLTSFMETEGLDFGARAGIQLGYAQHKVWTGSHTLVLFKKKWPDPRKKEASVAFIKYISEHSLEWARSAMLPVRYSILNSPDFKKIPYLSQIALDVDKFTFPVPHYRYMEGIVPISEQINLSLLNKLSPSAALDVAADRSTRQLGQDPD